MAKDSKKRFFYVLCSDKTWVFDQSERAQGTIFIIMCNRTTGTSIFRHLLGKTISPPR